MSDPVDIAQDVRVQFVTRGNNVAAAMLTYDHFIVAWAEYVYGAKGGTWMVRTVAGDHLCDCYSLRDLEITFQTWVEEYTTKVATNA